MHTRIFYSHRNARCIAATSATCARTMGSMCASRSPYVSAWPRAYVCAGVAVVTREVPVCGSRMCPWPKCVDLPSWPRDGVQTST